MWSMAETLSLWNTFWYPDNSHDQLQFSTWTRHIGWTDPQSDTGIRTISESGFFCRGPFQLLGSQNLFRQSDIYFYPQVFFPWFFKPKFQVVKYFQRVRKQVWLLFPFSRESFQKILNVNSGDRHLQQESISTCIQATCWLLIKTPGHISGRIKVLKIAWRC